MKRFILKTILLLIPIVILAFTVEYSLQHIPNDYHYKKSYLDKYSEDIQILIIGGSDTYYGVNPIYFSQNTFNASHVSQSLNLDYEIFTKYQNSLKDLKVIIIPISYITLWSNLETASDSWRMKNYAIYYGIKTKALTDHSELLNITLKNNIQRLYKYYIKKKNELYCSNLGWGTDFKSRNSDDLERTGKTAALRHTRSDIYSKEDMKTFTENLNTLNSFAEFCTLNNIELILLSPPVYFTYRENLNKEQLNKAFETLNDFVVKHNGCKFLNWAEDSDFVAKDFYDADHLNEIGTEKLSKKLVLYIDSLKIFKENTPIGK